MKNNFIKLITIFCLSFGNSFAENILIEAKKISLDKKNQTTITRSNIEDVVALMAQVPSKNVSRSDKDIIKTLERDLKLVIFGQDKAIESLVSSIKISRSIISDDDKPIGSFLFSGPTGVGKTEISKQLSFLMGIDLIKIDKQYEINLLFSDNRFITLYSEIIEVTLEDLKKNK